MRELLTRLWTLILDGVDAGRDFFKNLIRDFKESNRYFKMKVAIISGYVGISVATLLVFLPRGELNQIGAEVRISKTEIVGGRYFLVTNQSSSDWRELVLSLNGAYRARCPLLAAEKKKAFFFKEFQNAQGQRPPEEMMVSTLRIDCSEGAFEHNFQGGQ